MQIEIRPEQPSDHWQTEYMTKKAFWNLDRPGCFEHYLVHLLRQHADYLPELSRVAVLEDGSIAGAILYSRSAVINGLDRFESITFGPLCVETAYQRKGIGSALLKATLPLAKAAGHQAVFIYGEPEYYPRFGFRPCETYGAITTPGGRNFPAFMALELVPGALRGVTGKFHESEVFERLDQASVEAYDANFPFMPKLKLPGQWADE